MGEKTCVILYAVQSIPSEGILGIPIAECIQQRVLPLLGSIAKVALGGRTSLVSCLPPSWSKHVPTSILKARVVTVPAHTTTISTSVKIAALFVQPYLTTDRTLAANVTSVSSQVQTPSSAAMCARSIFKVHRSGLNISLVVATKRRRNDREPHLPSSPKRRPQPPRASTAIFAANSFLAPYGRSMLEAQGTKGRRSLSLTKRHSKRQRKINMASLCLRDWTLELLVRLMRRKVSVCISLWRPRCLLLVYELLAQSSHQQVPRTYPPREFSFPTSELLASYVSARFSVVVTANTTLTYGRPVTGKAEFRQSHNGRYEDRVEIIFEDEQLDRQFVIVRPLRAIVGSQADHDLLRPTAPFVPRKRRTREPETEVLPGVLPPALKAIPYVVKLPQAGIPKNLSETLSTGSSTDIIGRVRRIFLPKTWDCTTYSRHFKNLIWIEEYRMESVVRLIIKIVWSLIRLQE